MECRANCGVCCVEISISSPIPGMPQGKPAGVRCLHLQADSKCALFGKPERPTICSSFPPAPDTCGSNRREAQVLISTMEVMTRPSS